MDEGKLVLKVMGFAGLALAIPVVSAMRQSHPNPVRVGHVLDQPGLPQAKVVGVCDIKPESIKCWDMDGKPFQSLSDRIRAHYVDRESAQVFFRPGMKNRWIAFERVELTPDGWSWAGLESPQARSSSTSYGWRSGSVLEWFGWQTTPEEKVANIRARFHRSLPHKLTLEKGKSVMIDGQVFTFRSAGRASSSSKPDHTLGDKWKFEVVIDVIGARSPSMDRIHQIVLDKRDKSLPYVDQSGTPIEGAATKGTTRTAFGQIVRDAVTESSVRFRTNVDPKHLGSILFFLSQSQVVEFTNVPLDPDPSVSPRGVSSVCAQKANVTAVAPDR